MAALGMRAAALPVRATARVAARPLVARAVPLVQKAALVSQPLVRGGGLARDQLAPGPCARPRRPHSLGFPPMVPSNADGAAPQLTNGSPPGPRRAAMP